MLKVVLTGPESSGKSTLALDLVNALSQACLVPELARSYLTYLGRQYTKLDFLRMAKGQMAWQAWYADQQPNVLIVDTDHTVFQIWAQEKYGTIDPLIQEWRAKMMPDLYLLCSPEMPWEADPLRENPTNRHELYEKYHQHLVAIGARFHCLSGDRERRLHNALLHIQDCLK
jgi:nicotinamide riboside kinase